MRRRRVLKQAIEEDKDAVAGLPARPTCGTPTLTLSKCALIRGGRIHKSRCSSGLTQSTMNLEVA